MRIHTDTLTHPRVLACLRATIPGAWLDEFSAHESRSRRYAFEIRLGAEQRPGRRRKNVGWHGGDHTDLPFVPTYDEWGAFLAALYENDPHMKVTGWYENRADFHDKTRGKYHPLRKVISR